jgi:hypothetical protein
MRQGDFSIEIVPHGDGNVRELDSGHVLARPHQQYALRIRNHGPLYAVTAIRIDGRAVTAGGLVVAPWSATVLERPIGSKDSGRFTVVAEGDEHTFGPDGGRDNEALGLIAAEFRRELPRGNERRDDPTIVVGVPVDVPSRPLPGAPVPPQRWPIAPPEWNAPANRSPEPGISRVTAYQTRPVDSSRDNRHGERGIERAAGTGLGHSDQTFEPISLGPLETEATTISLRIVIGTEDAIAETPVRPLENSDSPARPAARP